MRYADGAEVVMECLLFEQAPADLAPHRNMRQGRVTVARMEERPSRTAVLLDARKSQLVLIDYQARLMPAIHGGENIVRNAARLAQLAQALVIPAVATEQSPEKLGPSLAEVREACGAVIAKTFFDAYPDGLREPVQRAVAGGRSQVVVAGCEAHVCL